MADRSLSFSVFGKATTSGFTKAGAEVEFLAGRLRSLSDKHVRVSVGLNKDKWREVDAGLNAAERGLNRLGSVGKNVFSDLGKWATSFSTGGLGQIGLIAIAIIHLAPIIIVISGLVAGLAAGLAAIAAFSVAGLAVGFLAAYGPVSKLFKAVSDGEKGIRKLPKSLQGGARAAKSLVDAFKGWGTQFEAPVGRLVASFSNLGKAILPKLTPVANGIFGVFDKIAIGASKALGGPIWTKFFDTLSTTGVKIFGDMASASGHFFNGLISMLTQTAPFASKLSGGIDNIAKSFEKWTQSARGQKDIREFYDWVSKTGPKVWSGLKDIGGVFWDFIKDMGKRDITSDLKTFAQVLGLVADGLNVLVTAMGFAHAAWSKFADLITKFPAFPGFKGFADDAKKAAPKWKGSVGDMLPQHLDAGIPDQREFQPDRIDLSKYTTYFQKGVLDTITMARKAGAGAARAFSEGLGDFGDAGKKAQGAGAAIAGGLWGSVGNVGKAAQGIHNSVDWGIGDPTIGKYQKGIYVGKYLEYGMLGSFGGVFNAAQGIHNNVDWGIGDPAAGKWEKGWSVGNRMADGISDSNDTVEHAVGKITGTIEGGVAGIANGMWDRGAEVGRRLASGLESQVDRVAAASQSLAFAIAGFYPASPVKMGPLKILNNGYTGRKIGAMIASGMMDGSQYVASAANKMAGTAVTGLGSAQGSVGRQGPAVHIEQVMLQSPMDVDVFTKQLAFNARGLGL